MSFVFVNTIEYLMFAHFILVNESVHPYAQINALSLEIYRNMLKVLHAYLLVSNRALRNK